MKRTHVIVPALGLSLLLASGAGASVFDFAPTEIASEMAMEAAGAIGVNLWTYLGENTQDAFGFSWGISPSGDSFHFTTNAGSSYNGLPLSINALGGRSPDGLSWSWDASINLGGTPHVFRGLVNFDVTRDDTILSTKASEKIDRDGLDGTLTAIVIYKKENGEIESYAQFRGFRAGGDGTVPEQLSAFDTFGPNGAATWRSSPGTDYPCAVIISGNIGVGTGGMSIGTQPAPSPAALLVGAAAGLGMRRRRCGRG